MFFPPCKICGAEIDANGCTNHDDELLDRLRGVDAKYQSDALRIHRNSMAFLGKHAFDCTVDDLTSISTMIHGPHRGVPKGNTCFIAREVADLDRADAALAEAARCGCDQLTTPVDPITGEPDLGRARVIHTCGL